MIVIIINHIIFNSIYLATLNGAILASDNADYPPYPMGDFQVFSFDGALSCLTLNDAGDDTQLTIGGTQCVNFGAACFSQSILIIIFRFNSQCYQIIKCALHVRYFNIFIPDIHM